ncbi:MAG: FG-GAP-like repeat-containing protein [Rubripirellula sp.]
MLGVATLGWQPADSRSILRGLLVVFLIATVTGCKDTKPSPTPANALTPAQSMRAALHAKRWQEAREFAQQALIASPDDPELLTDAATATAMSGDKREAASLLATACQVSNYLPPDRVDQTIQAFIDVGELYNAIELLQASLVEHPIRHHHRRILVGLLGEAQRTDLVQPHFERLIRDRQFDVALLVGMTDTSTRRFAANTVQEMLKRNPDDQRIRLGEAQRQLDDRDMKAAQTTLREVLQRHPGFAPAHALLGQALVSDGLHEQIPQWAEQTSADADQQKDHWLTLGDWADRQNQPIEAARSYWEATRCDANSAKAWSRLSKSLRCLRSSPPTETNESSSAENAEPPWKLAVSDGVLNDIQQRVEELLELRKLLEQFAGSEETSQNVAVMIANTLHRLGRNWEAEAWSAIATTLPNDTAKNLTVSREKIVAALKRNRQWMDRQDRPSLTIELSRLPIPSTASVSTPSPDAPRMPLPASDATEHLRLADETESRGLLVPHSFRSSDTPLLIDSMGAGGGTLDFDLDGAADVLIAAAGGSMQKRDSASNVLLRNLSGHFTDVTSHAGVGDPGFGQGIAVGDFDSDGFPDVFVANLGQNRLHRNNGDGTFADASDLLPEDFNQWTTCGAFVDLDQDGRLDLIAVNYCDTASPIDQPCLNADKDAVACHPAQFPAHADRIFRGTSDGKFVDAAASWLAELPKGRGLGILAGTLDGQGVGVLIANDMSANHYYSRSESDDRLHESAAVRGVAVDGRTLAQASMGIASGDFDGDGDLDVFVTGFAKEYNIFYRQDSPGFWTDDTARQGLVEAALQTVGFGTEATDLDDDGIDELVVTNGHIGDFGPDSPPHAQHFQVFRRGTSGTYQQVDVASWCDYLGTPHVGRALWTLDADGDLRSDLIVTHENEPPRLLVNRSSSQNHRIALRLVGTRCARDGTGAVVRFQANGRSRVLWSLSGDGYMCSNERILRAGLGNEQQVQQLSVTWPDGTTDQIGNLAANREYVIIQGSGLAF